MVDWQIEKLEDVADVKTGPFGSALHADDYVLTGTPIITVEHLGEQMITRQNLPLVSAQDKQRLSAYLLEEGDIVFSRVGSVDRNAYVTKNEEGWLFSGRLLRIRSKSVKLHSRFLVYYFKAEPVKAKIRNIAVGQTMASLNTKLLNSFEIAIPPLPEQRAIASALSDADKYITALEKLIAKKRAIRQGAMQELLTGKRKLPGFDDEWVEKTLGDLFDFSGGVSASRKQLSNVGYPYLHYGDIHGAKRNFIDVCNDKTIPRLDISLSNVSNNSLLQTGDVVFVDASEDDEGTSRHVVIRNSDNVPFISGLHTIVAKAKTEELDNLFLEYCFKSESVRNQFIFYSAGTKVKGVNRTQIAKINILFPVLKFEQHAIATILSDMDAEIDALTAKLKKARRIKQGMMSELLTGRIRLIQEETDNGENKRNGAEDAKPCNCLVPGQSNSWV